jgi:hypothetical protein
MAIACIPPMSHYQSRKWALNYCFWNCACQLHKLSLGLPINNIDWLPRVLQLGRKNLGLLYDKVSERVAKIAINLLINISHKTIIAKLSDSLGRFAFLFWSIGKPYLWLLLFVVGLLAAHFHSYFKIRRDVCTINYLSNSVQTSRCWLSQDNLGQISLKHFEHCLNFRILKNSSIGIRMNTLL